MDIGLVVFTICVGVAVMQAHLWQARKIALAEGGMSSVIDELQSQTDRRDLPVQLIASGPLY
jgi:hypothetical protein